jgi:hypothetical protein
LIRADPRDPREKLQGPATSAARIHFNSPLPAGVGRNHRFIALVTAEYQTIAALAVVAAAAIWLVRRAVVKRKNAGCGGECACPTEKLKR